jgi:hypothetical protein
MLVQACALASRFRYVTLVPFVDESMCNVLITAVSHVAATSAACILLPMNAASASADGGVGDVAGKQGQGADLQRTQCGARGRGMQRDHDDDGEHRTWCGIVFVEQKVSHQRAVGMLYISFLPCVGRQLKLVCCRW